MIYVTGLLVFSAVAAGVCVSLCTVFGFLTTAISWISLIIGALFGIYGALASRRTFREKQPLTLLDKGLFVFFILFCLRSFLWVYYHKLGKVYTLHGYHYADLHFHLAFIQHFLEGARFWPENPLFVKTGLDYHFGIDLLTAVFVKMGLPLTRALPLMGVTFGVATLLCLYRWGKGFTVAGFLFAGGIAGYHFFGTFSFEDYQAALAWKSVALTMFLPQRGYLFAFPAGLLVLWSWRQRFLKEEQGLPFWIEGLLWGMMPFFQIHTFLFLSFIFAIWSIATRKIRESTPVYLVAAAFAVPLVLKLTDSFQKSSYIWWKPGWMMGDESPLFFFLINFGFFVPLVFVCAFLVLRRGEKERRLLFFPALTLFIVTMFVMFCPWEWDNTKLIVWCYLMFLPVVDELVIKKSPFLVRVPLVILLFLSGFVCVISSLGKSHEGVVLVDRKTKDAVCYALQDVSVETRVAAAQEGYHPVLLCGRKVVAGYSGFLHGFGFPHRESVERMLRRLMMGEFDWKQIAEELGAEYLFWGEHEKRQFKGSSRPWEINAVKVASGEWGALYDLRKTADIAVPLETGPVQGNQGLSVRYFDNSEWKGEPDQLLRSAQIDFLWDQKNRPFPNPFSAIFEGEVYVPETGNITWVLASDDGSELSVDGKVLIDNLGAHEIRVREGSGYFEKGWHRVKVRYNDVGGGATLRLLWRMDSGETERIKPEYFRLSGTQEASV